MTVDDMMRPDYNPRTKAIAETTLLHRMLRGESEQIIGGVT